MTTRFHEFLLTSRFLGTTKAIFDDDGSSVERHHRITLKNIDNGRKVSFDYYPSKAKPYISTDAELLNAFNCFLGDATCVMGYTIDEFAREYYGGDCEVSKILATYDGCHDNECKALYVFDNNTDRLYKVLEEICDM